MAKEKVIKTIPDLEKVVGKNKGLWFIAIYEASSMLDSYRLKDMASLLEDGIPPLKDRWNEVLRTMGDWDADEIELDDEGNELVYPTARYVRALMKELNWR